MILSIVAALLIFLNQIGNASISGWVIFGILILNALWAFEIYRYIHRQNDEIHVMAEKALETSQILSELISKIENDINNYSEADHVSKEDV